MAQTALQAPDTVERVIGRGKAVYEAAWSRARVLTHMEHPGICAPTRVTVREGGEVMATMPRLDGIDIATLLSRRGGLQVGECVTVGIEVAQALHAMHTAGIAHGDLSASNVMVVDGRCVLVDTIAGSLASEVGTAPYAAPERPHGATAASDIHALGVLLRTCVKESQAPAITAWTQPMVERDPSVRPHAAMVARALEGCAQPVPLDIPVVGVVDAVRSRAKAAAPATQRLDSGRAWRVRRRLVRAAAVSGMLIALGFAIWTGATSVADVVDPPPQPRFEQPQPIPEHAALSPEAAGAEVTQARFEALALGDADALLATTAEGSTARAAVEEQANAVASGAVEYQDLTAEVTDVTTLSFAGRNATVAVTYEVSEHAVIAGEETVVYESYTDSVELDITWSEAGWQVTRARPLQQPIAPQN